MAIRVVSSEAAAPAPRAARAPKPEAASREAEALPTIHHEAGSSKQRQAKQLVTLRLDADILDKLRSSGPGWQTRANALLRQALAI